MTQALIQHNSSAKRQLLSQRKEASGKTSVHGRNVIEVDVHGI